MGFDILGRRWLRAGDGKVILRLIEQWKAGLTEHGDVVLGLVSSVGNDPATPPGQPSRAQFICSRDDARDIARMILRALSFSEPAEIFDFDAFRDRIRTPALRALADDWHKARGARRLPAWRDVTPGASAPYLNCMWGFDRDPANGEFRGRLAGSTIMQSFGKSLLGTPLSQLHPSPAFETAQLVLTRSIAEPACSLWHGALYRVGDDVIEGERLILPMGADPAHPDGVLGACWFETSPRFGVIQDVEMLYDTVDWCRL